MNDYYEFEQDLENDRKVTAGVDPEQASRIRRTLGLTALVTSLLLPILGLLADLETAMLGAAVVISSWLYSSPQTYFKGRPGLDAVTSVSLGVEIVLGGFSVYQSITEFPGLFLLTIIFILGPMHMVAQITDIVADREAGLRVTTTLLGGRRTLALSAVMFVFAHGLIVGLSLANSHPLDRTILLWSWPSLICQVALMLLLFRFPAPDLPQHTWPRVLTIGFVQLPGVVVVLVLTLL